MEPGLISSGWPATSWRRLINVVHYRGQKDGERTRTVNSRITRQLDSYFISPMAGIFAARNPISRISISPLWLEERWILFFFFAKIIHARNANLLAIRRYKNLVFSIIREDKIIKTCVLSRNRGPTPQKIQLKKERKKEKETNQCALCPVGVEVGGGLFRLLLLVSSWSDSDSLFILKVNLFSTSSMDLLVVAVVAFPPLLLLLLLFCVTVLLLLLWWGWVG